MSTIDDIDDIGSGRAVAPDFNVSADDERELTPEEELFVAAYLESSNAAESARRVGYPAKGSADKGAQFLRRPVVKRAIAIWRSQLRASAGVSRRRIVDELKHVAFARVTDVCEWGRDGLRVMPSAVLEDGTIAGVAEVIEMERKGYHRLQVRMHGKMEAMNLLVRMLGYNQPEKHQLVDGDGKPVKLMSIEVVPPAALSDGKGSGGVEVREDVFDVDVEDVLIESGVDAMADSAGVPVGGSGVAEGVEDGVITEPGFVDESEGADLFV